MQIVGERRAGGGATLRRVVAGLLGLALLALVVYLALGRLTRLTPPRVAPALATAAAQAVTATGARVAVGPSWLSHERGVWELHLEGEPYAAGWAAGRLSSRLYGAAEDALAATLFPTPPSAWARWRWRTALGWRQRHLGAALPPERAEALAGFAAAVEDRHPELGPPYQRLALAQALVELGSDVHGAPLAGGFAFAASGAASANGHLIGGRVFELPGAGALADRLDDNKVVTLARLPGELPYAAVGWPGLDGVVTGLNLAGLWIAVDGARSDDAAEEPGMPATLVARAVLAEARSLDQALARVRHTPIAATALFLVGDGKTGELAVIERSPRRCEVRRATRADGTLAMTAHALAGPFAADGENDRVRRYLPAGTRLRRLEELLKRVRGQLDPRRALEILRDRRGPGDAPLGLGHAAALDALDAVHGVVVDATALVLWVGAGPHLGGRLVAFDLRRELDAGAATPPPELPADALLGSPELGAYQVARAALAEAERLRSRDPARARDAAAEAAALAPDLPDAFKLLGDLAREAGDREAARRAYQRFLELGPPWLADAEEARGYLGAL